MSNTRGNENIILKYNLRIRTSGFASVHFYVVAAAVDERSKTVSQIKEIFVSCLSKSEDSLMHLKQFLQHSAI